MGLGLGYLVGKSYADNDRQVQGHADTLAELRAELARVRGDAVYQEAFKVAAAKLHEDIINEFSLVAAGTLAQCKLSDPANAEARNELFARYAARAVCRISSGKHTMSPEREQKIRALRPIK